FRSNAIGALIDCRGLADLRFAQAGLLHNLGLLWLATWMPAETHRALTGIDSDPDFPIRDALNQYCGLDYCEAGALLASAWQFPDTLIQALEHQADPNYQDSSWPIANLVGLGRALNATSRSGLPPPVMDPRLNRLGIEATDLAATFQRLEAKHHEIDELAQALFAR
ncbi:MAG TPA: HDOD domain-containing protein, partial [Chromatiaceae bacterium]|nr:HDOD domain-containing protein [Chromatiaceae bacterium]